MRVLVVEDELRMASLIRRGLVKEGLAADVAPNGEEALVFASAHPYDAIVLDVMLPGLNGFETCRRLREAGIWSPVLMLTARDSVEDRVAGLDTGADDYLVKPFAFAELLARLRALARRGDAERPIVLEIGDLRLDPATREVRRGGTPIQLTTKEFALLEVFMRRPGRCSRATSCSRTPGTSPTKTAPTWSTSTCAACAPRSTSRSDATRSRRSAARGTGCARTTVDEANADPAAGGGRLRAGDGGGAGRDELVPLRPPGVAPGARARP